MSVLMYHNPRCSKSRQTLDLLKNQGIEPEIVAYLEQPPDAATLERLLQLLGMEPRELMRTGEQEYQDLGLDDASLSRKQLIEAMAAHPRLMQRPIVVNGDRARVGRPPESVLEIL
jgi:arsenate reductase